jgi:hypothetical protein
MIATVWPALRLDNQPGPTINTNDLIVGISPHSGMSDHGTFRFYTLTRPSLGFRLSTARPPHVRLMIWMPSSTGPDTTKGIMHPNPGIANKVRMPVRDLEVERSLNDARPLDGDHSYRRAARP